MHRTPSEVLAGSTREDAGAGLDAIPRWPEGSVRALLATDLVREPTRAALQARLDRPPAERPRSLPERAFPTLRAVCARLVPQPERREVGIDLAGAIDAKLGKGNGWRYAAMPPDGDALRRGLSGVDETARALFGQGFDALDSANQDEVLAAIQAGRPPGATWESLPARRFFEEVLTMAVEAYYAHPLAQEEIGYAGMADAVTWTGIGLGQREAHEPVADAPSRSESPARSSAGGVAAE